MINPPVYQKVQFNSQLLRPEFSACLRAEARKYNLIDKAKSKKQWLIGRMVNDEWKGNPDYDKEIRKEEFYVECCKEMNSGFDFPVIGDSGQTLRRWCEVEESYAKLPALTEFREVLSFDHFFQARRMANHPEIYHITAPDIALAKAIENKWDAGDMVYHFSPKEPVHEYDKVIGWLDSLQTIKLSTVIKDTDQCKRAEYHLSEFRKIVEAQDDSKRPTTEEPF